MNINILNTIKDDVLLSSLKIVNIEYDIFTIYYVMEYRRTIIVNENDKAIIYKNIILEYDEILCDFIHGYLLYIDEKDKNILFKYSKIINNGNNYIKSIFLEEFQYYIDPLVKVKNNINLDELYHNILTKISYNVFSNELYIKGINNLKNKVKGIINDIDLNIIKIIFENQYVKHTKINIHNIDHIDHIDHIDNIDNNNYISNIYNFVSNNNNQYIK